MTVKIIDEAHEKFDDVTTLTDQMESVCNNHEIGVIINASFNLVYRVTDERVPKESVAKAVRNFADFIERGMPQ